MSKSIETFGALLDQLVDLAVAMNVTFVGYCEDPCAPDDDPEWGHAVIHDASDVDHENTDEGDAIIDLVDDTVQDW